jgi:hypothetical protein
VTTLFANSLIAALLAAATTASSCAGSHMVGVCGRADIGESAQTSQARGSSTGQAAPV